MKCFLLSLFIGLGLPYLLPAQQDYGNNWVFNDSVGINFNNNNPNLFHITIYGPLTENYATISDKNGNLKFYISGSDTMGLLSSIRDSNSNIILGGDSLPTHRSMTQGAIFLPDPDTSINRFYLLYINDNDVNGMSPKTAGLYYTLIDGSGNNGAGAVISDSLLQVDTLPEKITATRHGNGRDWWILTHDNTSNCFYEYLLTPSGITGPVTQCLGTQYSIYVSPVGLIWLYSAGQMVFSKNGDKLAAVGPGYGYSPGLIDVFDFDRCTGILSNHIPLGIDTAFYYGCSFSPNGKYLYVSDYNSSGNDSLFQYDLTAPNVVNSRTFIWSSPEIGQHQLAPDGKIYITTPCCVAYPNYNFTLSNMNLTVINAADSMGAACNLTQYSFNLGGNRSLGGLPNMTNYKLGVLENSVCDSLPALVNTPGHFKSEFTIVPNPLTEKKLTIIYELRPNEFVRFEIYNMLGQRIFSESLTYPGKTHQFQLPDMDNGVYNAILSSGDKRFSKKIIMLRQVVN